MENDGLLGRMNRHFPEFSKGQRRIAEYITGHYDKAAFMTAVRLGDKAGVSESTVVRFATALGYDGYPRLQKALQELILNKLTSIQRIEVSDEQIGTESILHSVLTKDAEKITATLAEISPADFEAVVDSLLAAKRVYIIGVRSSASLASFMGFYFNIIFDNVTVVQTDGAGEIFEQILHVGEGDTVVGISFPRYSRRTIQALRYARDSGANVVAITDGPLSPLTEFSTNSLFAGSDMASFADSLVAPLSVINALVVSCGLRVRDKTYESFGKLERLWEKYQVYSKPDDN